MTSVTPRALLKPAAPREAGAAPGGGRKGTVGTDFDASLPAHGDQDPDGGPTTRAPSLPESRARWGVARAARRGGGARAKGRGSRGGTGRGATERRRGAMGRGVAPARGATPGRAEAAAGSRAVSSAGGVRAVLWSRQIRAVASRAGRLVVEDGDSRGRWGGMRIWAGPPRRKQGRTAGDGGVSGERGP